MGLFDAQELNEAGIEKVAATRALFDKLVCDFLALNPQDGRALALMKTHLEDACHHAVKAICAHAAYQKTA